MKEFKCPHCGHWNKGEHDICTNCGKDMRDKEKKDLAKRQAAETNYMRIIPITKDDSFFQRLWKHPVRMGQLIFLGIISIIAAIASSTVH